MKTKLFAAVFSCLTIVTACGEKSESKQEVEQTEIVNLDKINLDNLLIEIKKREASLAADTIKMNRQKAIALVEAYATFQRRFKNRDKSPEYLFKAGEIAMGLNMTAESIKYLDKVYHEYPEYEKRPYSLFLKAFVLENQAQNYEEAKIAYELFINDYPTHEMADDAEYSIKNMGKTPEELIREFEIQDSIKKAQEQA